QRRTPGRAPRASARSAWIRHGCGGALRWRRAGRGAHSHPLSGAWGSALSGDARDLVAALLLALALVGFGSERRVRRDGQALLLPAHVLDGADGQYESDRPADPAEHRAPRDLLSARTAQQGHARGDGAEQSGPKQIAHGSMLSECSGCSGRLDSSSSCVSTGRRHPGGKRRHPTRRHAEPRRRPRAMTHTTSVSSSPSLIRLAGLPYFLIAFVARLPFAMMVVGVLTVVVTARGSLSLGGITSAAVGLGTALIGPLLGAAADRYGQRPVLMASAVSNAIMLAAFAMVVYSPVDQAFVL